MNLNVNDLLYYFLIKAFIKIQLNNTLRETNNSAPGMDNIPYILIYFLSNKVKEMFF